MMPGSTDATKAVSARELAGTVQAHITALRAAGASYRGIARRTGLDHTYISRVHVGRYVTVRPDVADRILAVAPGQAMPPVNRGGPGGRPATRIYADDLDVLASAGCDVPGAAARLGVQTWSVRAWCARSSRSCPAAARQALLARLERNAAECGQQVA
jgi:hypothetical protein